LNIIFDLDGTLIDSSDSILRSVEMAFEDCDIRPRQALTHALIGPPLRQMLEVVSGSSSEQVLCRLERSFKYQYDSVGYQKTIVYQGIETLLVDWSSQGHALYIATNKRKVPTLKIIEHLGWGPFFRGSYTLDYFDDVASKAELIQRIMNEHALQVADTLYIGDTLADAEAAAYNHLPCYLVEWGYGDVSDYEPCLRSVEQLYKLAN
jgi:phosphoglycolate phosphatase